jgi:hypothetical protein
LLPELSPSEGVVKGAQVSPRPAQNALSWQAPTTPLALRPPAE